MYGIYKCTGDVQVYGGVETYGGNIDVQGAYGHMRGHTDVWGVI